MLLFDSNDILSQFSILKADADSLVIEGTAHIYNIEFKEAEQCFAEIQRKYPEHPAGYFLDAMVD